MRRSSRHASRSTSNKRPDEPTIWGCRGKREGGVELAKIVGALPKPPSPLCPNRDTTSPSPMRARGAPTPRGKRGRQKAKREIWLSPRLPPYPWERGAPRIRWKNKDRRRRRKGNAKIDENARSCRIRALARPGAAEEKRVLTSLLATRSQAAGVPPRCEWREETRAQTTLFYRFFLAPRAVVVPPRRRLYLVALSPPAINMYSIPGHQFGSRASVP